MGSLSLLAQDKGSLQRAGSNTVHCQAGIFQGGHHCLRVCPCVAALPWKSTIPFCLGRQIICSNKCIAKHEWMVAHVTGRTASLSVYTAPPTHTGNGTFFFRATLTTYGGSQARGPVRAVAAGRRQSHSNARSEPRLRPTPQLTATPDPQPTGEGPGINPASSGILVRFETEFFF